MLYLEHVGTFFKSIQPLSKSKPELFDEAIIQYLSSPQRLIEVRIPWQNDAGKIMINHGYRVGHSNVLGPYKGGLRFRENVDLTLFKILAFEQTMKNALAQLDLGGAKGGADFNPAQHSPAEIKRFSQAFIDHMHPYFDQNQDVPAGDVGVSEVEIGYMVDQLQHYQAQPTTSFTGKGLDQGGIPGRKEATGYGLLFLVQAHLERHQRRLNKKRIIITGSGNVALSAATKAVELGALVVGLSDSSGAIYHPQGIDVHEVIKYKQNRRQRLAAYEGHHQRLSSYQELLSKPAELILPCATQNEIDLKTAQQLSPEVLAVIEGSNAACTPAAIDFLQNQKKDYLPSKVANAGGVIVSSYEMAQNQGQIIYNAEDTMKRLQKDMESIYETLHLTMLTHDLKDYVQGANIMAYQRLATSIYDKIHK